MAGAPPAVYLALALVLGFYPALVLLGPIFSMPSTPWTWSAAGLLILALLGVGLMLLLSLQSKIGRILGLTTVGFAVALLYGQLSAPDLVLTQLLVEVLTTVFFLLAVRFMVGREPGESKSSGLNFLRWTFAFGVGFASVALVLSVHSLQSDGRLPDYYFEAAPQIAQGLNLVNVTLVDFRALDTLVESLVVILACMGVAGVLTGREWLTRTRADRNESM